MAGIGFQLRQLSRQELISSVVAAFGHASVIAAGPWLFTILSLAGVSFLGERIVGAATLSDFRVVVIYAFAISLVLTAPITIVATRLVADALWLHQASQVPTLLFGAFMLSGGLVAAGMTATAVYFSVTSRLAVPMVACAATVALIWVALCFCGAVRDYRAVTWSFLVGLAVALVAAVTAAGLGLGAPGMVWGFLSGLLLVLTGMTHRVLATFPHPVTRPGAGVRALLVGLVDYRHLALGSLLGTAAVWIDKWIFWFSSARETVEAGLVHAPLYDSAMFIASLIIIPSLATFVVKLETDFFERYQRYYATIQNHGTYGQIETARGELASYTLDNLVLVTLAQAGLCTILVLTAPLIVEALNLHFRQIAILRYGAMAAVFQFVFIAATSMLLFFDRRRLYLSLQALFLVLNVGLTLLTVWLGEDTYGVGYFLSCVIASFVAYRLADATFERLNFLTFIANNPTILESTGGTLGPLSRRIRAALVRARGS